MRLAVIDMEGVLLDGEYLPELSKIIGKEKEVWDITLKGIRGEINWEEGLKQRVELLKGVKYEDALKIAKKIPLMKNAKKFCKRLKELGFKIVMLTGGFTIVAERIKKKLGLDYIISNELIFKDGKLVGVKLNVTDKAKAFFEHFGKVDGEIVAIVDGANDLELFKIAKFRIAFNAQPIVKKQADFVVDGKDLADLIPVIEKLFVSQKQ
ncbi:MAG: phosphoserine phosphatase SerB [Candidatus Aenigmatarchaeota archaeon]